MERLVLYIQLSFHGSPGQGSFIAYRAFIRNIPLPLRFSPQRYKPAQQKSVHVRTTSTVGL